jgi:hypothetical protein
MLSLSLILRRDVLNRRGAKISKATTKCEAARFAIQSCFSQRYHFALIQTSPASRLKTPDSRGDTIIMKISTPTIGGPLTTLNLQQEEQNITTIYTPDTEGGERNRRGSQ